MKSPFVHKFCSRDKGYVFDVHSGEIVTINDPIYTIIDRYNGQNQEALRLEYGPQFGVKAVNAALETIDSAQSAQDLFRTDRPEHQLYRYSRESLQQAMHQNLEVVTLGVTEQCNLRCSYCVYSENYPQRRAHSPQHMSMEVAHQAVDYLREHNSPDIKPPWIGFYGGEPLLRFDFIRAVTDYAQQVFPKGSLQYTLTSNGTILNQQMLKFLVDKQINLMISLDGPQHTHDRKRLFVNNKVLGAG